MLLPMCWTRHWCTYWNIPRRIPTSGTPWLEVILYLCLKIVNVINIIHKYICGRVTCGRHSYIKLRVKV